MLLSVVGKVFCKILNNRLVAGKEHCMKVRRALERIEAAYFIC